MARDKILERVKSAIRNPYAWPGGYPVYVYLEGGEMLCAACARAEYRQIVYAQRHNLRDGWKPAGTDVYWEGPPGHCAHCNKDLESAYGDPEPDD